MAEAILSVHHYCRQYGKVSSVFKLCEEIFIKFVPISYSFTA